MNKIITALKELISDIEAMQDGINTSWFGNFSENQEVNEFEGVSIEWPNLAISVEHAKAELVAYEAQQLDG